MVTIRLCKGEMIGRKAFALGVKNAEWGGENIDNTIGWYRVNLPESKLFVEINDGKIENVPVLYKNGNPVPAKEIVKHLVLQNRETRGVGKNGYSVSKHYGHLNKWYIDYSPELTDLFKELKLEIPEDGKSLATKMTEMAMGSLQALGFRKNEIGTYDMVSPGQKALEEAKAQALAEAAAQKDAEIAALKAQLEAATKQSENAAAPTETGKPGRKKKETVSV